MENKPTHYPKWLDSVDVEATPVQIVIKNEDSWEVHEYPNLAEAKKAFPDLDPYRNARNFTWAMRGELNGAPALRFENWAAENILSI
jgi:hypothetical protein